MRARRCGSRWRQAAVLAAVLLLGACEGVGIVATDNPDTKLAQAEQLRQDGRIMQARRMLDQAIPIFEQRQDKAGLSRAYREYALVALDGGANADPIVLRDPRAPLRPTTEELDLSDGYLKRAIALAQGTDELYLIANAHFVLGNNEVRRGNPQASCAYYDLAQQEFRTALAKQPKAAVYMPPDGPKDPVEFVEQVKRRAGCGH